MKILVGYDGTNAAKEALRLAKQHAKAFGAKVHVVTSMVSGNESRQNEITRAEGELAYARSAFDAEGIECETHLLIRGMNTGEDLVAFAKENGIDEIVVGVKRRSRVGKILLGSTAQYVIVKAPCPVLSVK
jgi:nucleotide-binding universal stress UspA family protein